jgi:molybdate transport system substrate-binding protein
MRTRRTLVALVLLVPLLAACSSGPAAGSTQFTLTVFAASSLKGAFTQIGTDFQATQPGTTVTFNFGPSDGLAAQIASEGTADVFASASAKWMDAVQQDPGVSDRADFATNRLVVITPSDDPAGIGSLTDLARPGVGLVLAAEGVPAGDYAREALANAGISEAALANVVSNEPDDASVVAKVSAGEADAGIVYASDVAGTSAPQLRSVPIPSAVNVVATYPIAVVTGTASTSQADAFVAYVVSDAGQATLRTYGFLPPGG